MMFMDTGIWMDVLFRCFILIFSIQWIMFAVSIFLKHERFFDLTGMFTFGLLAYLSYEWGGNWSSVRHIMQTAMICLWSIRLGIFLLNRIINDGGDFRFVEVRTDPIRFFSAYTLQGLWVSFNLLPTFLLNFQNTQSRAPIGLCDYLGWSMFCIGFIVEVIADYQKMEFRKHPENKNKFITSGMWSLSRHPNFCGDLVLWFGLYLCASSELKGIQQLVCFAGPLFEYLMIVNVSGILPLEEAGLERWGSQQEYQKYLRDTPVLVPFSKSQLKVNINWNYLTKTKNL